MLIIVELVIVKLGILILVDSESNTIVTINVVNSLIGENCVNINNFLNNECVNMHVTWYGLYNFLFWWKRGRHY